MKLYELADQYRDFESKLDLFVDMIEDGEMDEQAFDDTLAMLTATLEENVDACACAVKNMEAQADAMRAEEKRLAKRRQARENAADRLREYIAAAMTHAGRDKLETARNRLSFRKSTGVDIPDKTAFIQYARAWRDDLLTYKDPEPDKRAIQAALAAGQKIPGASMTVRMNLQIK